MGAAPRATTAGLRSRVVVALIAATFVISASFGLNMPLLPSLIAAVSPSGAARVPLHAGLLGAVFTLALGAAAPAWGALSDRTGRRAVLVLGMAGFAITLAVFASPPGLTAVYSEQFLSGVWAAAVMPVSSALVADLAPDDHWRASRLAWLNMALVAGFILGPVAGSAADRLLLRDITPGVLVTPFLATAVLAVPVVLMLWAWTPRGRPAPSARPAPRAKGRALRPLLVLTFVVSLAIGVFEVAIAIRGGRALGLSAVQTGRLFTGCSVVMFAAQAAVFSRWVKPARTAAVLAPAFAAIAGAMALAGWAPSFAVYALAVGLFAASGGVLAPVLAYWVSREAGPAQGAQLGRQTAAAGLGQAVGSAFAGIAFDVFGPTGAALWSGAAAPLAAAVLAAAVHARLTTAEPANALG
ncbi:MFS transporter [Phenylobacterium soli]|uniref:MFS transporter n=1 Tax=Phenylobacterium soli TaxID=2170551 RepID=A0A328AH48_9CAUL|nr:MFS transporter [Phenylobacterium soli]RAK54112.1 MFS transporter [Phenylobacterium soli]